MKKVSLNELMGSKGTKRTLGLSDITDLLGERMPNLEFSPVGKLRLTNAFRNRFGADYVNLPGVSDVMKEFDEQVKHHIKIQKMKMIRSK